jgi:hypothetical protein
MPNHPNLTNAAGHFIMPTSAQQLTRLADDDSCPIPAEPTQTGTIMKKARKRFIWITGVVAGCLLLGGLSVSHVAACGCEDTGPYFCLQDTDCYGCDAPHLPGANDPDCDDRDESTGTGGEYWACGYTSEEENDLVCEDDDPILCFVIKSCTRDAPRYNELCMASGTGEWACRGKVLYVLSLQGCRRWSALDRDRLSLPGTRVVPGSNQSYGVQHVWPVLHTF